MPVDYSIKFGTAGWRGVIAREFTFDGVRLATQAIADYLKQKLFHRGSPLPDCKPMVILGYDTRFLAHEFALAAAEVLAANDLMPLLSNRDTPSPAIAHAIRTRKALGGINITASHNPAEYQGLKFSLSNGAPATPDVTRLLEARCLQLSKGNWTFPSSVVGTWQCKTFDPAPHYCRRLHQLIDFETIAKARLKVAVDLMHGTGRGYLDTLLEEAGASVTRFGDQRDPRFGGRRPEPDAEGLETVRRFVRRGKAHLGLGLDGDADRFGIVDRDGTWLTPNQVLTLALYHLKKHRGWTGGVVRTVPTSHQVDALAALLGVPVYEVPTGFKHIGALMERRPIIVGGEESGGLTVKGHVPDKDGILACLLMTELVAIERRPLGRILKAIEKQIGPFISDRLNVQVTPEDKSHILRRLKAGPKRIGSFSVRKCEKKDGFKFLLPKGEWVAFRPSGTEPLFRCYIEAHSQASRLKLRSACERLLQT